jgi:hypothetical protein
MEFPLPGILANVANNRVMNLRKVCGYIPDNLNNVLRRFSFGALVFYDKISQISNDLADCVASLVRLSGRIYPQSFARRRTVTPGVPVLR